MLTKLPAWIVPNDVSVEREAAPYRHMPLEQKLRLVRDACRTAARLARAHPRPDLVYTWVDPLPPSTIAALKRLQADYRQRR
jgi:hypothetical protein